MSPFIAFSSPDVLRQLLLDYPALGWSSALLLGLLSGSFLSCVVYRLPVQLLADWHFQARHLLNPDSCQAGVRLTLLHPPSHCPQCQTPVGIIGLIPVLGYVLRRGVCRGCGKAIGLHYPLLELAGGALALYVYWRYGLSWQALALWLFGLLCIALGWIDLRHTLLPDQLVGPLLWLGLVVNYFGVFVPFSQSFWGCIIAYLLFALLAWLARLVLRKEALGWGDVKLFAALGAWLGWYPMPLLLFVATSSALVFLLLRWALAGISLRQPMPFGAFLAGGGWVVLAVQPLWSW